MPFVSEPAVHSISASSGTEVSVGDRLATPSDDRTARILARSVYRDLREYGIARENILQVASELIGLVTDDLAQDTRRA